MLKLLVVLVAVKIILFVEFTRSDGVITEKKFDDWECSSLCTDQGLRAKVKRICVKLRSAVDSPWDKSRVERESGCVERAMVWLQNDQQLQGPQPRQVGVCRLNDKQSRCVTKGEHLNQVYVYDYGEKICHLLPTKTMRMPGTGCVSFFFGWLSVFGIDVD